MHKFLVDMANNTILQKDMEDLVTVSPILRELSNTVVAQAVGVARGTDLMLYVLIMAFGFTTLSTWIRLS